MVHVTRLVTFVEADDCVADPRQMSVSARHEAVLTSGGRVLLLADRGWSASGPPDIWAMTSVEEIADTARMVVGPDEPFGGRSQEKMEEDHWSSLAAVLRHQGVDVDAAELGRLPHDVVLGEQLLARIGHQPGDGVEPSTDEEHAQANACAGCGTNAGTPLVNGRRRCEFGRSVSAVCVGNVSLPGRWAVRNQH